MWGYIDDNNQITIYTDLPPSWKNISGFNLLDEAQLNQYGWWRAVYVSPPGRFRDRRIVSYDNVFNPDKCVVERYPVFGTKNQEELRQQFLVEITVDSIKGAMKRGEHVFSLFDIQQVRFVRDIMLSASDYTQLPDIQDKMSPEMKELWRKYRQDLRDLPTPDLDVNQPVIFPTLPIEII